MYVSADQPTSTPGDPWYSSAAFVIVVCHGLLSMAHVVTVAQSDLVGFTKLASQRNPKQVVEIISDLFGHFDAVADEFGVYKVEANAIK